MRFDVGRRGGQLRLICYCAALNAAAFVAPAALGEGPSQLLMLGDSSADSGTYSGERPVNAGNLWIESVAQHLGFAMSPARRIDVVPTGEITVQSLTGSNYAASSATVLAYVPFPNLTFADQVQALRYDQATIDKDALVMLQFDSNDAFYAFALKKPYSPQAYAAGYLAQVAALKDMGARNIVAMGDTHSLLPEGLYTSPAGAGFDAADVEAHRQRMIGSRAALWPQLMAAGVYVVDLDKVAADVAKDLGKYGFTSGPEGWMTHNGPNDGHVFTYDGHYTSAMQDVFADFTVAQLRAREQFAHILTEPMRAMRREATALEPRLGASAFNAAVGGRETKRASGDWQTYSGLSYDDERVRATGGFDDGLDVETTGGFTGADVAISSALVLGSRLAFRHGKGAFGRDSGGFERDTYLASAYSTLLMTSQTFLNAALSYAHMDYSDITRNANLGPVHESANGETRGAYWSARIGMGHGIEVNTWRIAADAALTYERSNVEGFEERGDVLGIAYGTSHFEALQASMGLRAELAGGGDTRFRPHVAIAIEHDLFDDDAVVKAGPTRGMLVSYDVKRPDRTTARATFGGTYAVTNGVDLTAELSAEQPIAHDADTSLAARLGISMQLR